MTNCIDPEEEAFENIVGKGENAGNQHYLFPKCFYSIKEKLHNLSHYEIIICKCFRFR